MEKTREQHLAWCKERALMELNAGDISGAYASMASNLNKHPDTRGHLGIQLGMMMLMSGSLSSKDAMRRFIDGFN